MCLDSREVHFIKSSTSKKWNILYRNKTQKYEYFKYKYFVSALIGFLYSCLKSTSLKIMANSNPVFSFFDCNSIINEMVSEWYRSLGYSGMSTCTRNSIYPHPRGVFALITSLISLSLDGMYATAASRAFRNERGAANAYYLIILSVFMH